MGGNVAVLIRKEDGQQIIMDRWTNVIPHFLNHANLYIGKWDQWFADFSKTWEEMKLDYEKNKDTGKYKLNMTSVYFPFDTFSPSEYGMIVIDCKEKKIYSAQNYCSVGEMNIGTTFEYYLSDNETDDIKNFQVLFQHGFIKTLTYWNNIEKCRKTLDISGLTYDEILNFINEFERESIRKSQDKQFTHPIFKNISREAATAYSTSFNIESDWEIVSFNDNNIGLLKVREILDKSGFQFNQEDNQAWKEYLKHAYLTDNEVEFKNLYKSLFNQFWVYEE